MKKIIITIYLLIAALGYSQTKQQNTSKPVTKLNVLKLKLTNLSAHATEENGYTVLLSQKGDLNKDSIEDIVVCYKNNLENMDAEDFINTPKRKCVIFLGTSSSSVIKFAENLNTLLLPDGNGNPLAGITIKNGYFSLEHKSLFPSTDYTTIITYKFDVTLKNFIIHKNNSEEFDRVTKKIDKTNNLKETDKGKLFNQYVIY